MSGIECSFVSCLFQKVSKKNVGCGHAGGNLDEVYSLMVD